MPAKSEKMLEFFRLVSIPTLERVEQGLPKDVRAMSKHLGVMYATAIRWHAKARAMGISKINKPDEFQPLPETKDEKEWAIFMRQLTADAAQKGATAPTRTLYAQLKGKMPKTNLDIKIGLSADERIRRMFEADKELEEFKQLEVGK